MVGKNQLIHKLKSVDCFYLATKEGEDHFMFPIHFYTWADLKIIVLVSPIKLAISKWTDK
jgi:hypothetical protein